MCVSVRVCLCVQHTVCLITHSWAEGWLLSNMQLIERRSMVSEMWLSAHSAVNTACGVAGCLCASQPTGFTNTHHYWLEYVASHGWTTGCWMQLSRFRAHSWPVRASGGLEGVEGWGPRTRVGGRDISLCVVFLGIVLTNEKPVNILSEVAVAMSYCYVTLNVVYKRRSTTRWAQLSSLTKIQSVSGFCRRLNVIGFKSKKYRNSISVNKTLPDYAISN